MLPAGFETANPASDLPQTPAFDRSATGIRTPALPVRTLVAMLSYPGSFVYLGLPKVRFNKPQINTET